MNKIPGKKLTLPKQILILILITIQILILSIYTPSWGQVITTIAGGGESGDNKIANQSSLNGPHEVVLDKNGDMYIADTFNHRIRHIDAETGIITTIAGNGEDGFSGDGGPATQAILSTPSGIFVDDSSNLYIVDTLNHRIRFVDAITGTITTVAGSGENGFSGDGGPATQATLSSPIGVFVDKANNLYIADWGNNRIRRVDALSKTINTIAGKDTAYWAVQRPEQATQVPLKGPTGIVVDNGGNLYIAEWGNCIISYVDWETGILSNLAGTGDCGFSGDGRLATQARLDRPHDLFIDQKADIYVADLGNHRIRRIVGKTRIITTVSGNGNGKGRRPFGDGGPAKHASLFIPSGIFLDQEGSLYIADTGHGLIRKVAIEPTLSDNLTQFSAIPDHFTLDQNHPNPFNAHTRINYQLSKPGHVLLQIYNVLGQNTRVLAHQFQPAGLHQVLWDGKDFLGHDVAGGIYFYQLTFRQKTLKRSMLMLK